MSVHVMLGALLLAVAADAGGCGGELEEKSAAARAQPGAPVDEAPEENVTALTEEEEAGLLYVREEEKLARDVYLAFHELYGDRIFENIAQSEQSHVDSMLSLLETYGLPDPAEGLAPGEFHDPSLQALHDDLISQGSESLEAALRVGATIEDLDIVDLRDRYTEQSPTDVQTVYENLSKGSRNHLRSFVDRLTAVGETYEPVYLTQEEFDAIVSSETETGRQ